MASRLDRYLLPAWLAATALAALGWWFGSGVQPLWWLTWLAPLPVLWLAPRVRARWAALAGFAAYAIGGINQWEYLHGYIGLPVVAIIQAIGTPALMLALCVLLLRRLLLRGHPLAAAWAAPAMWVACEYVNNLLSPHGTFFNIGYTQMDALALIQIAAITGIWGIGFLVLLLPASLAALASPRNTQPGRIPIIAITALCIAATVAYGCWRLQAPAPATIPAGPAPRAARAAVMTAAAAGPAVRAARATATTACRAIRTRPAAAAATRPTTAIPARTISRRFARAVAG